MSNKTQFEVVLIWSRRSNEPTNDDVQPRQYSAYNRVFDAYPTDDELATVVATKHAEIEESDVKNQDPQFHRMELRTVEIQDIDLTEIVDTFNETHYPETGNSHDRGCDCGDEDDGC